MHSRIFPNLFFFLAVVFTPITFADENCPAGLKYVGAIYAEDSGAIGKEAKVPAGTRRQINLPENFVIDTSYQQTDATFSSHGGTAGSNMGASFVPSGFHLIAAGSERASCAGWSIQDPKQVMLKRKGNQIIQEGLELGVYCHSGSGEFCKDGSGCNVRVDVCVKEAK
ncbi:MAG: hypothetical protein WC762_00065 [Methylobacter sp.]|jgi:hypothetical protein